MNEELKIIITAAVQDAVGEVQKVNKELQKIEKNSVESGKSFTESMKTLAKGAAVAAGAIAAVTTAMVALGNKSAAAQKEIGKLETAFQSVGSSAKQAQNTYRGLYRFMGDAGAATEAAGHLAKITTNSQDLAEWTKILQGVYSTFGASLPIESLTEAANESLRVGQVTGTLADALNWAGVSEDEFNAKLAQATTLQEREALLRSTLNGLYMNASRLYERNNAALIANAEAQARLDAALADAHRYLTPLMTSVINLSTTLLTYLKPALEVVAAVLITFIQYIITAIKWVASFFSIFDDSGSSAASSSQSIANNMGSISSGAQGATGSVGGLSGALDDAASAAKELKKQTMGFDELNVIQPKTTTSSGSSYTPSIGGATGGGVGGISLPSASSLEGFAASGLGDFQKTLDDVKAKLEGILVLVGLVAIGYGMWKLSGIISKISAMRAILKVVADESTVIGKAFKETQAGIRKELDDITSRLKYMGGMLMIIAGSILTIIGYSDAWVNGIDWKNFAETLGGVALVIGGIILAFGGAAGAFASVIAGVALFVVALKDMIKNGASVENVIMMIAAALMVAIPIVIAFNTALIANPIGLIITAIVALIAAIAALVVAFVLEEPAIKSVEDAQNALNEAIEKTIEAENNYISALDSAEAAQKKLEEAEKAAGISGEELRKQVEAGTLTYADMTDAQKECYKAYLDNEQKQKDLEESTKAYEEAKKAETIASYENQLALAKENGSYDDYKKSVIDAFNSGKLSAEEARDLIAKSMSEMSDDAQQTFMEDLPSSLKDGLDPHKYESTGTKITKWFSNLWKGIQDVFANVGAWFADIGKKIGDAVSGAVKTAINWILEKAIGIINGFLKAINFAIGVINLIPGVNITKLNLLEVPKLATGGIVTRDTLAHIGEGGKREAVLPLDQNTGWMDTLADRISQRNGAPSKVVLEVDGKELGWATINGINDITHQTGNLQLRLA